MKIQGGHRSPAPERERERERETERERERERERVSVTRFGQCGYHDTHKWVDSFFIAKANGCRS
jgi:hypothetical protein